MTQEFELDEHFSLPGSNGRATLRVGVGRVVMRVDVSNVTFGFCATASKHSEKLWLLTHPVKEHCLTEDGQAVAQEFQKDR